MESLSVRLAKEDPRFGYGKLQGEKKLVELSQISVKHVLQRHGIPPVPERKNDGASRQTFLSHYQDQLLACDFFTVETAWLKTVYDLFFIELGTKRVHFAGCTAHPVASWITQQAHHMAWTLEHREPSIKYPIHDRDTKCGASIGTVLASEGIERILTFYQAPNANAFA